MYDIFITLVHNAALLITLAYAYSLISVQERTHSPFWIRGLLGIVVSSIGLSVMLTSWELDPGIVLDTRSVLLSGAGLFLGFVPTVTAMLVTTLFHYAQGSPGVAPGALIAIACGSLGLLWRHHRQHILVDSGYTANAIVHRGILDAGVRLLKKPFSARELAAEVREILDQDCG